MNNLEAYREGQKEIDDIEIIFVDIQQTNSTGLSKVQNAINHAISNKRVKFKVYKYNDDIINTTNIINICKKYIPLETCWVLLFFLLFLLMPFFLDIEPTTNIPLS